MILVDTSVWVDHLRRRNEGLLDLLEAGEVVCHPFVLGEMACSSLGNREEILSHMAELPSLPKAQDSEALDLIDRNRLMASGLGLIDVHLLASCLLAGVPLWTRDAKLAAAALKLGLAPAR